MENKKSNTEELSGIVVSTIKFFQVVAAIGVVLLLAICWAIASSVGS